MFHHSDFYKQINLVTKYFQSTMDRVEDLHAVVDILYRWMISDNHPLLLDFEGQHAMAYIITFTTTRKRKLNANV